MVRPIKSDCCGRLRRTRTARSTFKRAGNQFTVDKESKLTVIRMNMKNENHQRDAAVECQL
jgi:hypothetical protein